MLHTVGQTVAFIIIDCAQVVCIFYPILTSFYSKIFPLTYSLLGLVESNKLDTRLDKLVVHCLIRSVEIT